MIDMLDASVKRAVRRAQIKTVQMFANSLTKGFEKVSKEYPDAVVPVSIVSDLIRDVANEWELHFRRRMNE